jgi:hypothetical protein
MRHASFWHLLIHRWFIQYNPLYLVSATLVLGGMTLVSRALAQEGNLYGPLGVSAIAEVYGLALIGGAALLTRIGLRRPGVMLAILAVLYQGDLTLHTETCVHLGQAGIWAAAAWLAMFVGKLYALAWAVKVRFSRGALVAAVCGALGLAILPHLLGRVSPDAAGSAIALWLFALGVLARRQDVSSLVPLDGWGRTVLRRSTRATWILWAVLVCVHVLFWSTQHEVQLAYVLPIFPLLATRYVRSEARAWIAIACTLGFVFFAMPFAFSTTAILVAATLALRSLTRVRVTTVVQDAAPPASSPYRAASEESAPVTVAASPALVPLPRSAQARLWAGALAALHAAVWTFGWTGGRLPAHAAWLDVTVAIVMLALAWRLRDKVMVVPPALGGAHALLATGLVPSPRSGLEWGLAALALGFALLGASLGVSYRLRRSGSDE